MAKITKNQYIEWIEQQSAGASKYLFNHPLFQNAVRMPLIWMKVLDGNAYAALLMSQIWYWHNMSPETESPRMQHKHNGQVWIVKSYNEWAQSVGFSSAKTVQNNMNKLREKGLIVTERHQSTFPQHQNDNGSYKTVTYVRMNWAVVDQVLQGQTQPLYLGERPNKDNEQTPYLGDSQQPPDEGECWTQIISEEFSNDSPTIVARSSGGLSNSASQEGTKYEGQRRQEDLPEIEADKRTEDQPPIYGYVAALLTTCKVKWKNVSLTMRDKLMKMQMVGWKENGSKETEKVGTPVEVYESNPKYREWVEETARKLQFHAKAAGKNVAKSNFITSTTDYLAFQNWLQATGKLNKSPALSSDTVPDVTEVEPNYFASKYDNA